MTISPSSSAREAQRALGLRLRLLRTDAGLTGRALASQAGWHFTKVSKIENGVQSVTGPELRTWCGICGREDQEQDLLAQAQSIQSMYVEFRQSSRAGLKQLMLSPLPLYERTARFRIYEHNVVPGIFQTPGYIRAMLPFWFTFLETKDDLEESAVARLARQSVLHQRGKTFAVVLEQSCLQTRLGDEGVLADQLEHLLSIMNLSQVSLGIIPSAANREVIGSAGFWIFDTALVKLETPTASIEVTRPQEIALYDRMFAELRKPAVYGREARSIILSELDDLRQAGAR